MDTSETYIKMCDCLEVQGQKEIFIDGDWFAYYDPMAKGKKGELKIAVVGANYYRFDRKDVNKYSNLSVIGFDEGESELVWESKIIWIPLQDQIQEILLSDEDLKWNIPKLFGNFIPFFGSNKNYERFNSMEKLWLAFCMKEKYRKSWDDNEWVL